MKLTPSSIGKQKNLCGSITERRQERMNDTHWDHVLLTKILRLENVLAHTYLVYISRLKRIKFAKA